MNASNSYQGAELELFAKAINWKKYLKSQINRYLQGSVLEVGAGIGETTSMLFPALSRKWTCIEPDARMAAVIGKWVLRKGFTNKIEVIPKKLNELPEKRRFDTIIYIDVLEHIKSDKKEVECAANLLTEGGHLIILSPAHEYLYTEFDKNIGHYRRYSKSQYIQLTPDHLKIERIRYLDSVGVVASAANKLILNSGMPTLKQIKFWDGCMIPMSKLIDPLFGYALGKSILGIWKYGD